MIGMVISSLWLVDQGISARPGHALLFYARSLEKQPTSPAEYPNGNAGPRAASVCSSERPLAGSAQCGGPRQGMHRVTALAARLAIAGPTARPARHQWHRQ